jgi:hypothetical protein
MSHGQVRHASFSICYNHPVHMSSSSSPPKPKPGSLRDRIAAFEQKPASSSAPPPAPRPKPGNLSQWKPRSSSPHDTQPANDRNDTSMSASDAKESITKAGSLKERMAALQGLGAFGGGSAATPPPKPAEKPKWKPPPQVAIAPPLAGDDEEGESADADNKPAISQLKTPNDDILATLSKHPQPGPAQEKHSEIEGEAPVAGEEVLDPDEMANALAAEPAPRSEDDTERTQAEIEVAANGAYICASCCQVLLIAPLSQCRSPPHPPPMRLRL